MPHIDYAIKLGDLTGAQRRIFQVIERHDDWAWSMSMKDLSDLARWSIVPAESSPPPVVSDGLHPTVSRKKLERKHGPTVNTVRKALKKLHGTKKIWCFELRGTKYYASFGSRKSFERSLKKNGEIPSDYVPEVPLEL